MSRQATMTTGLRLLPVGSDDLAEVAQALDWAGLPSDDLPLPGRRFFRAADAGGPVSFGGLKGDGPDLLLRSVVVRPDSRRGHGAALVRALEERAAALGGERLHPLTTTAAGFFVRLGYAPAARETAPTAIAATAQFASLCPASAGYLVKALPARARSHG